MLLMALLPDGDMYMCISHPDATSCYCCYWCFSCYCLISASIYTCASDSTAFFNETEAMLMTEVQWLHRRTVCTEEELFFFGNWEIHDLQPVPSKRMNIGGVQCNTRHCMILTLASSDSTILTPAVTCKKKHMCDFLPDNSTELPQHFTVRTMSLRKCTIGF